jgi:hypothetical protein
MRPIRAGFEPFVRHVPTLLTAKIGTLCQAETAQNRRGLV